MAKYRKRPLVIDAEQWQPDKVIPGVELEPGSNRGRITTAMGRTEFVEPGDYVVREADGVHWYPWRAEVFEAMHERMDTSDV